MLNKDLKEELQMYNNALQSTYYKISNTDVKSTVMDTSKNERFVVKVFVINILQIFLSILMTALVFAIFAGVITFLSVSVEGMFVFISWMLVIILSIVLFLIGINIHRDLTLYFNAFLIYTLCIIAVIAVIAIIAVLGSVFNFLRSTVTLFVIGLLAIAIVIPVSSLEAQILYGGKHIYYRPTDLILASMVHWFLTTFLYSAFIFLCVSISSFINKYSLVYSN
ncbi:hypothetical protein KSF78_0004804 [Schistosoma japonicum]|nr:hypothetical protein KSF78_0004804 [Schistosoma japonicum]